MRRIALLLVAVVMVAGVVICMLPPSRHANGAAAPIFAGKIPPDTATGGLSPWPAKKVTSTIYAPNWAMT